MSRSAPYHSPTSSRGSAHLIRLDERSLSGRDHRGSPARGSYLHEALQPAADFVGRLATEEVSPLLLAVADVGELTATTTGISWETAKTSR